MFGYIPAVMNRMSAAANASMSQANGVMMWNTIEFKNDIMKWGLLCALTKGCMAPPSVWLKPDKVNKWCPKGGETKFQHHICHRYDQSLFAVLLRNHYEYDASIYQMQEDEDDFLAIPERTG